MKEEDRQAMIRVMEIGFSALTPDGLFGLENAICEICNGCGVDFSEVREIAFDKVYKSIGGGVNE